MATAGAGSAVSLGALQGRGYCAHQDPGQAGRRAWWSQVAPGPRPGGRHQGWEAARLRGPHPGGEVMPGKLAWPLDGPGSASPTGSPSLVLHTHMHMHTCAPAQPLCQVGGGDPPTAGLSCKPSSNSGVPDHSSPSKWGSFLMVLQLESASFQKQSGHIFWNLGFPSVPGSATHAGPQVWLRLNFELHPCSWLLAPGSQGKPGAAVRTHHPRRCTHRSGARIQNQGVPGLRSLRGLQGRVRPASPSFGGLQGSWAYGHIPPVSGSIFTWTFLCVSLCPLLSL